MDEHGERHHDHGGVERQKQGVSSFDMQDPALVFRELKLGEGDVFLDLGCGAGDYAIQAAKIVKDTGKVYALDRWKEVIEALSEKAGSQGLSNVRAVESDIVSPLPLEDRSVDVCLMAQVLHGLNLSRDTRALFAEISRVLKPGGRLAILEFKKEETGFGPPVHLRISPEEIEAAAGRHGFKNAGLRSFEHSYLIQFRPETLSGSENGSQA